VQKALGSSLSSAQWLLAALQRLDLCLPVGDAPNPPGCPGPSGAKLFILPPLLEFGAPSQDVWPDMPEWDEKQVRVASRCVAVCRFLLSCSTPPLAVGVSTAFLSVTRVCLFYAKTTQQINDRFPCTLGLGQFVDLRIVSSVLEVGYNAKYIGLCMLRVFSVFWASVNAEYLP